MRRFLHDHTPPFSPPKNTFSRLYRTASKSYSPCPSQHTIHLLNLTPRLSIHALTHSLRPCSSLSRLRFPNPYATPPPTTLTAAIPIAAPLTSPLAPNRLPILALMPLTPVNLLRDASNRYSPDHAAVRPAASILNPERLRYVEKKSTGGKSRGRGCTGLRWSARVSVARSEGGREESVCWLLVGGIQKEGDR